jgi:transposase
MRGSDRQTGLMFSYVSPEALVPPDHPLRAIQVLVNAALERLSGDFDQLYAARGRDSIAPEKLLRALLLQAFYSVRSERRLMEQVTYNMLFRWFVGLSMDAPVWDVTVFTKNRDRLLRGEVAGKFFAAVLAEAGQLHAFSQATSSGSVLAGTRCALTTSTLGVVTASVMGAKSRTGS